MNLVNPDNMASTMAEWLVAHNEVLGHILLLSAIMSGIYVSRKRRQVRLWCIGVMAAVAITCVVLIPFLP